MSTILAALIATLKPIAAGYVVSRVAKRFPVLAALVRTIQEKPAHEDTKEKLAATVKFTKEEVAAMDAKTIQALGIKAEVES